ncbi:MAG: tryptophan--tRNA ligase [candidate division Zixibacteria bacterium]|nr:tryptophan--tRNA ligase [candidate division Zixibacteria bacterium]
MARKVVLSGMQPTGRLHLGNYEGALKNWVKLQDQYEAYYMIVDWHALTSDYRETAELPERIRQMAIDFLAAGVDPEKAAVFVQSQVKEHAELFLLFAMIIPTPWLERVPSYKEKSEEMKLDSYGFLGYPLLQAADILIYRADLVPVGKDQLPHIELTREVCRRFNSLYGEVFPEPQELLTKFPVIPGTDGRKMSKSYGNDITLAETAEETAKKVSRMFTDPKKIRKGDPGRPEICPVYHLHQIYTPRAEETVAPPCRTGELGCVDCKANLAKNLNAALAPLREKRRELEKNPAPVEKMLSSGALRARARAAETMKLVRKGMHLG